MYDATPTASRSSSSCTASPVWTAEATTSVGARSSFGALSGPAASLSAANAAGPTTRKRHGSVRLCAGAQRASSNRSSSVSRGTGSRRKAFCVRLVRIACSSSTHVRLGGHLMHAFDARPRDLLRVRLVHGRLLAEQPVCQSRGEGHHGLLWVHAERARQH